jgi:hypothetical protein
VKEALDARHLARGEECLSVRPVSEEPAAEPTAQTAAG